MNRMMNLSASSSKTESNSYFLLDKRIQRWIWESGWSELKDIQEQSIPLILEGKKDIILAAATASGKTEAAFLPILTRMLQEPEMGCVLYISPIKALINDQWGRLDPLCEGLEIPITPWHGDITASKKKIFLDSHKGCLLITPESLEALLMNRGHALPAIFSHLRYIVIDELHAFIGTERGKQLQSLMHRIDIALRRIIPRIALSATLGDMGKAGEFLRPKTDSPVEIIVSRGEDHQKLKVLIKGYIGHDDSIGSLTEAQDEISQHLFKKLRGSNNLVFPNSRVKVELYSDDLRKQCDAVGISNEFLPHHGNLSKEIREETESALKSKGFATAICTSTLELGIDIGAVRNIAQIGPAPSVASLRQRLGRSGRKKGEPAILWGYVIEEEVDTKNPRLSEQLHERLILFIAQVRLLVQGWYEPPQITSLHLSTLVQQLLSLIAQYGGINASSAWQILCASGPFNNISQQDFILLLRELGAKEILMQSPDGQLLHGTVGEKIVNHYKFYASFVIEPEYRIVSGHKTLGTLSVGQPVNIDTNIIFAGKRWKICNFDLEKKLIEVLPAYDKNAPFFSGGSRGFVDDQVRQEMYRVLAETDNILFLDATGSKLLNEARSEFQRLRLVAKSKTILINTDNVQLFLWRGDRVQNTLLLMLIAHGFFAKLEGDLCITVNTSKTELFNAFENWIESPLPDGITLVSSVINKQKEKWDNLLPEPLLSKNYASSMLDIDGAFQTIIELMACVSTD